MVIFNTNLHFVFLAKLGGQSGQNPRAITSLGLQLSTIEILPLTKAGQTLDKSPILDFTDPD